MVLVSCERNQSNDSNIITLIFRYNNIEYAYKYTKRDTKKATVNTVAVKPDYIRDNSFMKLLHQYDFLHGVELTGDGRMHEVDAAGEE